LISAPDRFWIAKRRLHRLIPPSDSHLLYGEHLEGDGARFFELVCEQDLEGIICKPRTSRYPFIWIKVKNPNYSQAAGRGCCRNDSTKPNSSFPCLSASAVAMPPDWGADWAACLAHS
jgi:hypothetical protein